MNIYLIGFMGSGKSTIGQLLAKELDFNFIDMDSYIEDKYKAKIKDIFKEKGETYFRQLEKKELQNIINVDNYVISTGGGLGADIENLKLMKSSGITIWLDASLKEILKRCEKDTQRPLLQQPLEKIEKLYKKRKEIYSLADIHIKVDGKKPEEIVEEIIGNIHRYRYSRK